jgi:acylphosphatase
MLGRKWSIATISTLLMIMLFIPRAVGVKGIKVFADQKRIEVEGEASKELGRYEQLKGAIEYLACAEGGKTYESILVLHCEPSEFYEGLIKIGLRPGAPATYDDESGKHIPPKGDKVNIFVEWKDSKGKIVRLRAEDLIYNKKTRKTMQHVDWVFAGSRFMEDPETEEQVLQAQLTKSIVSTHHGDQTVILQNPLLEALDESIYTVNQKLAPKPGTKVKIIIDGSQLVQVYVLISGEVQGVEFRDFTKQTADQMNVCGYVKNLPDGRVEAVLEGQEDDVSKVLEKLRVGPQSAKVTDVETEKRKFTGKYKDFQIHR